jgi:bifunctional non-homologous end joining protein LigD
VTGPLKGAKPGNGAAAHRKKKDSGSLRLPEGATKADLPLTLQPQLATLVDGPPNDPLEWTYEIKFDGYRIVSRIDGEKIQLFTRNGNDWSHKLPHLVKAVDKMGLKSGWLDGEVMVLNDNGLPDFQALQNAFDSSRTQNIIYYVFDVPFYDGYDLRTSPLIQRRQFLEQLFATRSSETVRFSATFDVPASEIIVSPAAWGWKA